MAFHNELLHNISDNGEEIHGTMINNYIFQKTVEDLLNERDYVGAIGKIYSNVMGPYTLPIVILIAIFGVYYTRKQSIIPVIILSVILFALIMENIPPQIMGFGLIIIAIGIGVLLYQLFTRERQ